MSPHDTPPTAPTLAATWFGLLAAYRDTVRQERLFVRLVALAVACTLGLGRQTLTRWLVSLGAGAPDWTAWYRLFNRTRLHLATLQGTLAAQVLAAIPPSAPVVAVAVDATQLPRTSGKLPGGGVTRALRGLRGPRGLTFAQRYVGVSALLPRSPGGDSRALPLKWLLLRTATTRPMGEEPVRTEAQGGRDLVGWVRHHLDAAHRAAQRLLVLGDGSYSTAPFLADLPQHVTVLARCARNRALFALPVYRATGRGRQPRYGTRGPTPQATLHRATAWQTVTVAVRGRTIPLTATVTGPWLIQGAPFQPLALIVVRGIDRGKGVSRRQRDPQFFLVTLDLTQEDEWALPLPLEDLLAWAWQRWEVEVMHRELKSGFGLGQQQAFSTQGAAAVVAWLVWLYALLILTGYRTWGLGPGAVPDLGRWYAARRWSIGRLRQGLRQELWQLGEFQPVWTRSPDTWAEITAWVQTQTTAVAGARPI
jgi:DDE superfamily endonuclease